MQHTTLNQPRAWVGCLACYNAGRLVGSWYDADEAEEDIAQIHQDGGYNGPCDGEEPWCFDTENIPRGEMDPLTAQRWGELYNDLDDDSAWPALLAYLDNNHADINNLPDLEEFTDAYQGVWPEFIDYVYHLADEVDFQHDWSEEAIAYFDWDSYAKDLENDYHTVDAPKGFIFIFHA